MLSVGVVEDDPVIRRVVAGALELAGHHAVLAHDGAEALSLLTAPERLGSIDVVVLDVGLPDSDGRDVCQALRTAGQVAPVIFLTALGGMHDRLAGFSAGADDYLAKPFEVRELLARVEALGRRGRLVQPQTPADLVLDPARHGLSCRGRSVALTPTEFRMLAAITSRPGEVVRRRAVVAAAWPDGAAVSENTVDSYVRRIRSKLEELDSPVRLHTVRGVGYELR